MDIVHYTRSNRCKNTCLDTVWYEIGLFQARYDILTIFRHRLFIYACNLRIVEVLLTLSILYHHFTLLFPELDIHPLEQLS